jgi:hypothetical protein
VNAAYRPWQFLFPGLILAGILGPHNHRGPDHGCGYILSQKHAAGLVTLTDEMVEQIIIVSW